MRNIFVGVPVFVLLIAAATVSAQTPQDDLLARMERARQHDNVCMLLNRSGAYRMEIVYPAKTEVYIGTLPPASIAELEERLNQDELRRLSQEQIFTPPITYVRDRFDIDIRREHHWQSVKFVNEESRKPFAQTVNPLLKWFEGVAKGHPGASRVNAPADTCVPPPERVARTTGVARESPKFVLRWEEFHPAGAVARRMCVLVSGDGRFWYEKAEQRALEAPGPPHVYKGSLSGEQLREVRNLLDVPELKLLKHTSSTSGVIATEWDIVNLAIPRDDGIQNLKFTSYFGRWSKGTEPGGMSNMRYHTDEEMKLIEPIRHWLTESIDKHKGPEIKAAATTACVPPPE